MFKNKKQKTSFSTILFVICSLVGLVFLIWFFYSIKLNILATKQYNEKFSQEEIYPKFIKTDPFIYPLSFLINPYAIYRLNL